MAAVLQTRRLEEVNTDPQRRCYNGCHAKSALVWGAWEDLEHFDTPEQANDRIEFWQGLNDYAVSQRGKAGTKREFKVQQGETNGS